MCRASIAQIDASSEHFDRGAQFYQSGDIPDAINEYEECLKLAPERIDAISNLGAAFAKLNRFSEAIEQYQHAVKLTDDPRIRMNLALAFYKSDRIAEAIVEFSGLHEKYADQEQVATLLAVCYFREGLNQKVVDLLRPLAAGGKGDKAVAYLLGTALIRNNQIGEGEALIARLLEGGESAETQLLIGTTQLMRGEIAEAVKTMARAVELNPDLPEVFVYYGMALLKSGDPERAEKAFRRELDHDPGSYEAMLNLGSLLRDHARVSEALPLLSKASELRPQDARARLECGKAYLAAGRVPEAAAELEAAERVTPDSAEIHRTLADVYQKLDRPADRDTEQVLARGLEEQEQSTPAIENLHRKIMEKLKPEAQ